MWSYKKPEFAGWYFVNFGDVVTDDSFDCVRLTLDVDGSLCDKDGVDIKDYTASHKFMNVGISSLNQIRNKD